MAAPIDTEAAVDALRRASDLAQARGNQAILQIITEIGAKIEHRTESITQAMSRIERNVDTLTVCIAALESLVESAYREGHGEGLVRDSFDTPPNADLADWLASESRHRLSRLKISQKSQVPLDFP